MSEVVCLYPELLFVADADSWLSIQKYGLLPISILLERSQVGGRRSTEPLYKVHQESMVVEHSELGAVVMRDQKPINGWFL